MKLARKRPKRLWKSNSGKRMPEYKTTEELSKIPAHIAIIMDGNGRWAEKHHLPHIAGHRAGTENLRQIIKSCVEFGVRVLTIYAFSTENWKRPTDEVNGLMQILAESLDNEMEELHKQGTQLRHIGRMEHLNPSLRKKVASAIQLTKNNQRLILNIAWNYGGRDEIIYAIENMLKENLKPDQVNEQTINQHLFTAGLPDPDLVIRTSGEIRTSNFLLWQTAYSEWYFTSVLWPDFNKEELYKAIQEYGQRERRFGGRNFVNVQENQTHAE
jgi:undecaprenyl diphosphate synthase